MIKALLQHKSDTFIALLMPCLLMAMTQTHNSVFLYAIIAICALHITKPIIIFPVYFISSLSTAYFAIADGVSAGRYLSLIMIVSLAINLLIKGSNNKGNNLIPIWFLFALYCFLSSALSVTGSFVPFILLFQGLLVLLLLPNIKGVCIEYFCSLLFFSCIIALIGIWIQFASVGFDRLLYERYRGAEGNTNSNRIAMMVMQLALVIISPFIANEQNKIIRWLSVIGFVLAIIIILLTGSRASLLACLGAFVIIFLKISSQNIKKYIIPFIVIISIAFFIIQQFNQVDSQVIERFSFQSLISTGGSDRLPAIQIFISKIFPQYPLFGVGLGGENFNVVAYPYGIDHPCHNIFFDSLAQIGLFGIIIFICLFFSIFNKSWHYLSSVSYQFPLIIALLLVIGAVINGLGETVYVEKWFWNALSLCMLFNANKQEN